jgi:hypothetical protein
MLLLLMATRRCTGCALWCATRARA